ncbi:MAG TPA: MBL fold metallo-hydrolase [Candidatus Polarisedimenticolaceae bacterium]|nr:MBL fold metallo-hydrolase [Candidatus Polarisedimenticolaceae bacterium]
MIRFEFGEVQLTVLDGGSLWLDGGAMFGIVPKVLWERERTPDEQNRIRLAMNLLLIEDGRERTLVDTGAGDKWDAKGRAIYRIEARSAAEILAPAGLRPEQIDRVINTHLHFDHAGGNTVRREDGTLAAAFPNASYVVQQAELDTAAWDHERIRASYFPDNYAPLQRDGRLFPVVGDAALGPRIRLRHAPGHTPGMQLVLVETAEGTVAFMADLLPTASHAPYPWIMAYDLEPLVTFAVKKRVLPEALADGWWLVLEHDAACPLATLHEVAGRLRLRPHEVEA